MCMRERNSRSYCIDSNQILLLNDKDQPVHMVGCAPGQSLPSMIVSFPLNIPLLKECSCHITHFISPHLTPSQPTSFRPERTVIGRNHANRGLHCEATLFAMTAINQS